ncbi:YceI family protein [Mucilaginibacter lappiensis]|uniref:YceI family protein n=1 Tax=Mucilaginibacter lappiensis TaxID=354630 RepID=UPI003D1FAA78
METKNFNIETSESIIAWTGRKVTGFHNGTIAIKSGWLIVNEGIITGGKFIIDTTSIKDLDISDPDTYAKFIAHLASDDFFSSEKFPEAVFEIVSAAAETEAEYAILGNLTIKDITNPVSFKVTAFVEGDIIKAAGKITIDRTKYNMIFRSGNFFEKLGDTLIYNDFDLDVSILAKEANV